MDNALVKVDNKIIDNRLMTIRDASKQLNIPYMTLLMDKRLRKVRINRYYKNNKAIAEVKVESPGRFPMIYLSDLALYQIEIREETR